MQVFQFMDLAVKLADSLASDPSKHSYGFIYIVAASLVSWQIADGELGLAQSTHQSAI